MAKGKPATTVVSHSEDASKVLEKVRTLREQIPGFAQPSNKTAARRLVGNAGVSDDFLETVAVAVQASQALKSASEVDPAAMRDAIRFAAAYGPVADELESLASAVRFTINVRRAESATEALAAYDLAKGLARKKEGASLVPHISDIRKALNRGGHRKVAAKPAAPAQS